MNKTPKVFVSYSWDNAEQQDWVIGFVNSLRSKNVDATLDVFETQKGTINLNAMMVNKLRESDYIVIMLTDNYVNKADNMQGGVGYETTMLLSLVQENLKKIIPIMTKWNINKVIPFYLRGVHYIDFSDGSSFDNKFDELLHRIFKVDMIEQAPLGTRPHLTTRKIKTIPNNGFNDLIPNLREITDLDKNKFLKESYLSLKGGLLNLLEATKVKNKNFDYDMEDVTTRKCTCSIYINGNQIHSFKIWLGAFGAMTNTINFSYGHQISDSDNSANEIISCEITNNNELKLKMMMNVFGNRDANTPQLIIEEIWNQIANTFS